MLIVLTDDQRWDSLGCYGNGDIATPNIDALAAAGARFDAFYDAIPLCCPSRATFLTGRHAHETGIVCKGADHGAPIDIPEGMPTIATHLGGAGYATGFVGKAHLGGDPTRWGFKDARAVAPGGGCERIDPTLRIDGREAVVKGHSTEIFVDAAIAFLRDQKRERPWLLWLATTAPHSPNDPPERMVQRPPPGWPPGQAMDPLAIAQFSGTYASVERLDRELGRLFREIDALDLAATTLVILASDNGFMMGSHGIRAKDTWYEESARVPCLVRWPGVVAPGSLASLGSSVDLLPTCLEAAGVQTPPGLEGVSLVTGKREAVFSSGHLSDDPETRGDPWFLARRGMLKLVTRGQGDRVLYDLAADPHEERDRITDPTVAADVVRLDELTAAWLARGDAARYFSTSPSGPRKPMGPIFRKSQPKPKEPT